MQKLWQIKARHVQSEGYNCGVFYKFCSSKHAMHNHKSRHHKGGFLLILCSSAFDDLVRSKIWKNETGLLCCSECDFSSQFLTNVKNHIEAKHLQAECHRYNCTSCGKFFKTKNSFQTHKSRFKGRCATLNQANFWIWRFWGASGLESVEGRFRWILALLRLFLLHPVPDQPERPHWDTSCNICWVSLSNLFQILPH